MQSDRKAPKSLIGAVADVIGKHYYSHSKLNSLFMESGAPGDAPEGNCVTKCIKWLSLCNADPDIDALSVAGNVIQHYMDSDIFSDDQRKGRDRITRSLAMSNLRYHTNGTISHAGLGPSTKTLETLIKEKDFQSIENEFQRAVCQVEKDPHAALTAASSILEALFKVYIAANGLKTQESTRAPILWETVRRHLFPHPDKNIRQDKEKILQGLSSIISGVTSLRTHIGSAHGRGIAPAQIEVCDSRLAVNASHSVVLYIMEKWNRQ